MCGIAGIFLSEVQKTPSHDLLSAMIQTLYHRGPDAQKVLIQPGLGFAHARLSIIDLHPSSDQPMGEDETGNLLVFNGEIYNYLELKAELVAYGYQFKTASDTEVILKAYAHWGESCLSHFNGMWAFVLYDKRRNRLFAARDRLGIKPLVFGMDAKKNLIFASEAKAVVQHVPEFKTVNWDFLLHFIEHDFFACFKETFYQKINNLLPGHYFLAAPGETPVQQRYWTWQPAEESVPRSDSEIVEQFSALLQDSIRLRFRSDVPVGACLSGGVDSGTVVGLAHSLFPTPMQTFSCVYPQHPVYDESSYIQASVKKFNTQAYYIEPQSNDFIQLMRDCVYEQDGPTGGASVLSQRAVMALAGQHVKVVLDGQGADEVLGGYHGYFRASLQAQLRAFKRQPSLKNWCSYRTSAQQIKQRIGFEPRNSLPALCYLTRHPVSFKTPNWQHTPLQNFTAFAQDDLNTLLLEHVFTNLSNLLHYEDRNSMRFSVESRLPYLDYRLVEFAFSLNHQYKIRGSTTKWLLSQVAKTVLPTEILTRRDKMGFSTPAQAWLSEPTTRAYLTTYFSKDNLLLQRVSDSMRQSLCQAFDLLGGGALAARKLETSGMMHGLWRFMTANLWLEVNR